jgi:drug/metabolite transporter (DMT)-like permease
MDTNASMNPRVFAGLITVGVISGSAFTTTKLLTDELTTFSLAQGRLMTAAASMLVLMAIRRNPIAATSPGSIARVAVLAMLDGVIPYMLVSWAAGSVEAGLASVLIATMPLFTAVIAAVTMKDEGISVSTAGGIGIAILGVAVLAGPGALNIGDSSTLGMFAVVAAASSYGAGTVYARSLLRSGDPVSLTGTKLLLATLFLAPITFAHGGVGDFVALSPQGWVYLAILGVAATGLGRSLYLWVVRSAGSVRASLVTYITPVVGVTLGWAVLGESVGPNIIGGGVLIAAGVASVMFGRRLSISRIRPSLRTVRMTPPFLKQRGVL